MSTNFGQQVYAQGSGTASTTLFDAVRLPRNPTTGDNTYPLGKFWVNTTSNAVWYLGSYTGSSTGNVANWANLSAGSILMGVLTINNVFPDGAGNFTFTSSDGSISITPIVNGLNLMAATSPTVYQGNSGGNVTPNPIGNLLTINGNNSTGINVIGNSPLFTLTVNAMTATTSQQGTLLLATNAQAIAGTDAANAVTSAALAAKLGTQTAHSLALFEGSTAAMTPLGVATNGQIPIGSTGADPVLSTLTAGTGISITNGAGAITIAVSGSAVLETLTGNSGGAISPTAGNINTLGTGSITIAGSGSTLTTQLTGLTNHNVLIGAGTATITKVAPSATSGVPLISQGAAADPTFGTAVVAGGGTGITSATAYAVLCGGTTSTNPFQSIASVGTSGQILTSNGAGALPTFQAAAASSITLTGDTGGGLTGNSFTFNANTNCGSSVLFAGSGTTLSLKVTDASSNTIIGGTAGNGSLSGTNNTSVGSQTLELLTSGTANSAFGLQTLERLTTGSNNAAYGAVSLGQLTTGGNNTALGYNSLGGLTTGSGNIAIGMSAGGNYTTSESNNIVLLSQGVAAESNTTRIGIPGTQTSCYIAGIQGVSVSNKNIVTINTSTSQLGSDSSVAVAQGGTGNTTFTAYSVICAGTTATGAFQNVSGVGTAGQVLTSNGAAALPTWQSGASVLAITTVAHAASPYTVLSTDQFLAVNVSGGVVTIKLPNAPTTGRVIYIKDSNGAAATSNISVTTVGGTVTIDGQTTYTMATNYQSLSVVFDGSNYEVF